MNATTSNKTTQRKSAQMERQFIKAMIELDNVNKAALFASVMSLSEAGKGKSASALLWWQVVSFLRPDVAQKFGSHLRPDISKKVAEISQPAHHKTQKGCRIRP